MKGEVKRLAAVHYQMKKSERREWISVLDGLYG